MTLENRFATVTVRIPVAEFLGEDQANVWHPSEWPYLIRNEAKGYMAEKGFEVTDAQMEGEVYQAQSYTYYIVWNTMGSIVAQYKEFASDPPSVKEIQMATEEFNQAVFLAYQKGGQPLSEPPQDTVLFFFAKVSGRQDDAIPHDAKRIEGETVTGDEVDKSQKRGDLRTRKRRNSHIN